MKHFEKIGIAILMLLATLATQAQSVAPRPKLDPALITRFHFQKLYGGVIIIKAALDDYPDSLNFILDTGSGGISLDSLTAAELGVPMRPSGRTIRGIAGVRPVQFAFNHRLRLPGLTVDSLDFHINDYEMLSGIYGVQIDGIIGYSFFKRYVVALNFDLEEMYIYPPGPVVYPRGGHILRPAIAALPMQYAEFYEDRSIAARYYIDTGAGLCLLLSEAFVKDSMVFGKNKHMVTTVAEGIGGKRDMRITVLKKFKLGKYHFRKMPTYIFEDEFNVTSYPFLGGLIGNDLLRRFNMIINYSKSEVHLLPNKSFREPFDYTYTGFNMYQQGYDVLITDVMEGSPAADAGLREGDVIVGIGNKFGGTLQDYKNLIKEPGSKMKILISRNGELINMKFAVQNLKKPYRTKRGKQQDDTI